MATHQCLQAAISVVVIYM